VLPEALEFISVDPLERSPQSYTISLRNNSNRNLYEVEIQGYNNGVGPMTYWPRLDYDRVLAHPGEVFKIRSAYAMIGKMTESGFVMGPLSRVEIVGALFEDGIYEGTLSESVRILAARKCRKERLTEILDLIQDTIDHPIVDAAKEIEEFISFVPSRPVEPGQRLLDRLWAEFSKVPGAKRNDMVSAYMASFTTVNAFFLNDVNTFRKKKGAAVSSADFSNWLIDAKQRYQQWLNSLQRRTSRRTRARLVASNLYTEDPNETSRTSD
jgi:hypothetical protein